MAIKWVVGFVGYPFFIYQQTSKERESSLSKQVEKPAKKVHIKTGSQNQGVVGWSRV